MKYRAIIAAFLTLLLLAGCGKPAQTPEITPEPEPIVDTIPEKTRVVFANPTERMRPYFIDLETGEITLAFDARTIAPILADDQIYYLERLFYWGYIIHCYDLTTGEDTIIDDKGSLWYMVEGDNLVFSNEDGIFLLSRSDGTKRKISDIRSESGALVNGWIYYNWSNELRAYNCDSGEERLLGEIRYPIYRVIGDYVYIKPEDELPWISYKNGQKIDGPWNNKLNQADGMPTCGTDSVLLYFTKTETTEALYANPYIHPFEYDFSQLRFFEEDYDPFMSCMTFTPIFSVFEGKTTNIFDNEETDRNIELNAFPIDKTHCLIYYINELNKTRNGLYCYNAEDATLIPLGFGENCALFAEGDFPRLHTSTSRAPLAWALYRQFVKTSLGLEGNKPEAPKTHQSWLDIADRTSDIGLLAPPTEEEQAYLKEKGVEVEQKLYGGDALVFIGNQNNPVQNLTHDQIMAIYRGEITNWAELGGPNAPISVYYRDDQSGSQRMFNRLVFDDEELPDFYELGFTPIDVMSYIVDQCSRDEYSIGYSVLTFLNVVYQVPNVKVFSVNDVTPAVETIEDGSYPFGIMEYVVIRADEPEDSPARRLYDWFGCTFSQEIIRENDMVPLNK